MKWMIFFQLFACLQVTANGFSQSVTISEKNAPLKKVLLAIKKQTGYTFIYTDAALNQSRPVTIQVTNAPLEKVLDACFSDQPLSYTLLNKVIVIKEKTVIEKESQLDNNPIDITGRVINEAGEPLAGVAISVKRNNRSVLTNANGEFALSGLNDDDVLVINSVAYETQEIRINNRNILSVTLIKKVSELDQTVVIGYGLTTKRMNTGSVNRVSGEDIKKQPVANPLAAITGRVPGLQITQQSGVPGSGFTVRIRGQNSIASGNDPLYIIDGVPFTSTTTTSSYTIGSIIPNASPLNLINSLDIESIEILKDADATAIYGSRGANGVILISTNKGKAGNTKVEFTTSFGIGKITRKLHLLSSQQYLQMRREGFANDGSTPQFSDYDVNGTWDTTRYTDFQKLLIGGTAKMNDNQISISGGTTSTQYSIGGSYYKETTVFPGKFSDEKYSVHLSIVNSSPNKKFKSIIYVNYISDLNKLPKSDLITKISLPPNAPKLFDSAGELNWEGSTWENPLSGLLKKSEGVSKNIIGNASISYLIFRDLQIKINIGYNYIHVDETTINPLKSFDPSYNISSGTSDFFNNTLQTWLLEPQISWDQKLFNGKLTMLAGATLQENRVENEVLSATNFTSDDLLENIKAASTIAVSDYRNTAYRYAAIFGRLNYNLNNRMLINLTGRRDGSSRFGPNNQFANFGAIGLGWIFSNEKFFQQSPNFLSFGKIRLSYGITGNDQIPDYGYLNSYVSTGQYQNSTGLFPARLYNPDYAWEKNKKFEAVLELGFLNDNILITGNFYKNRSSNQLVGYPLPPTTGFTMLPYYNLPAVVQNTGIELEIITRNIKNKNFEWTTSFNLSIPRNKLIKYPNLEGSPYANIYIVGQSLFIKKMYTFLGVDSQTGVYQFEDVNNDGTFTTADKNKIKFVGQYYFGGLQNRIQFKGLQLDVFFQFVKQNGINYLYSGFNAPGGIGNQPAYVLNRWEKPGDNAPIQLFTAGSNSMALSKYFDLYNAENSISDASFVRLKNLSLSWNVTGKWLSKINQAGIRVFLQGQNLFTLTSFKGFDPENQSVLSIPPLRVLAAGIQLTL